MAMALTSVWWAAQQPMWTRMTITSQSSLCERLLYVPFPCPIPQSVCNFFELARSDPEVAASGIKQKALISALSLHAIRDWDKACCHTRLTHMHPACRILLPGSRALDLVCHILAVHA